MADAAAETLTPAQRQAILLHLTGGGDPAHAGAVAQGAITPALAQQLAAQAGGPAEHLTLAQMQQLSAIPQGSAQVSDAPQLALDPALASLGDPAAQGATAPVDPAPTPPVTASAMPAVGGTNQEGAQAIVGNLAVGGAEMGKQGAQTLAAVPYVAAAAANASDAAAQAKVAYQKKYDAAVGKVLKGSNEDISQLDQDEMDQQAIRARTMNDMLSQMLDAANQAATAAPHDFWADKSTSSRIFGIISQVAGGMANGLANQPGQPTPLDRVIQRDLDQQRLDFAQKSQSGNQASGIYNDLIKATGSTTTAYGALRIAAYKRVLGQIDEVGRQFPDLKASAELTAMQADVKNKLATTLREVGKAEVDAGTDAQKVAATGAVSLANEDTKAQSDKSVARITAAGKVAAAKAGKEGDANDTGDFLGIEVVPGKEAYVKTHPIPKERRAGIETSVTGTENIKREGQELFNLLDNPGGMDERSRSSRIDAKRATILRELTKAFNAGNRPGEVYNAMTAGGTPTDAIEAIRSMLGREWVPGNEAALRAAVEETINSVEAHTNSQLAHYGRRMAQAPQ